MAVGPFARLHRRARLIGQRKSRDGGLFRHRLRNIAETLGTKCELINHIGIEYAFLLQIMRDGVLRQERSQELDFSADPFAFRMRGVGGVVAAATATELWAEVGTLNLVQRVNLY
jgi:hypothetical protein